MKLYRLKYSCDCGSEWITHWDKYAQDMCEKCGEYVWPSSQPERKITLEEWQEMTKLEMRMRVPDYTKDEDIDAVRFTWDAESDTFVVVGYDGVKH